MKMQIVLIGRGKSKVVVEGNDGRTIASTTGLLADRKERVRVVNELRDYAPGLDAEHLLERLLEESGKSPAEPTPADEPVFDEADEPSSEAELAEAKEILRSGDLVDQIEADLTAIGIAGEDSYKMTAYLVATSRMLRRPLHAIVQGDSSSGKSHVAEKIADLLPREHVVDAMHLSPKALYRMEGMLSHRFLFMGERSRQEGAEIEDSTRAIRELRSRGRLTSTVLREGDLVRFTVEGPVASIETTTNGELFPEDANRCLLLYTDESKDQTDRILDRQADDAERGEEVVDPAIRRRHVGLQRVLADLESEPIIRVPFSKKLRSFIPSTRIDVRRTFPMLLGMIRASAFLHRFQRELDSEGRLLADVADYRLAKRLTGDVLAAAIGDGVTEPVRRFWESLRGLHGVSDVFTAPGLSTKLRRERQRVNELLRPLRSLDVVELIEEAKGPHPAEWRVKRPTLPDGGNVLPEPEALR